MQALSNLKRICEEHLSGKCQIEVIDLLQKPPHISAGNPETSAQDHRRSFEYGASAGGAGTFPRGLGCDGSKGSANHWVGHTRCVRLVQREISTARSAETSKTAKKLHNLRLYVAGSTPRSLRAVQNLKHLCDHELNGQYQLEVVDIYKEPRRAKEDQIIAIPTLIKRAPGAVRRLIGDLSQVAAVRKGLELHRSKT
jgi:circadian clock protein KaiB